MDDWNDLNDMIQDMRLFAKKHEDAVIICSDNPHEFRLGWNGEYEEGGVKHLKRWTISLSTFNENLEQNKIHPTLASAFNTSEGRMNMIEAIVKSARKT